MERGEQLAYIITSTSFLSVYTEIMCHIIYLCYIFSNIYITLLTHHWHYIGSRVQLFVCMGVKFFLHLSLSRIISLALSY